VADDDLQRKEHAGDGRVEGGGDGGRDAATEQRPRQCAAEMQLLRDEGAHGGAKMDDRPFAARRCPRSQRDRADYRGSDAVAQRHPSAAQGAGDNNIGDGLRPAAWHQEFDQQADRQPAAGRDQQDMPPRQHRDQRMHALGCKAETNRLDEGDAFPEHDSATAGDQADNNREGEQDHLLMTHHATDASKIMRDVDLCHVSAEGW
jgi:hypothetical protein